MKCCIDGCEREAVYKAKCVCRACFERIRRAKNRKPSLMDQVEALLNEHGAQDAQALARHLPDYDIAKIGRALANLANAGRARCIQRTRNGARWGGGLFATCQQDLPARGGYRIPRVASVFDLGSTMNPRSGGTAATT